RTMIPLNTWCNTHLHTSGTAQATEETVAFARAEEGHEEAQNHRKLPTCRVVYDACGKCITILLCCCAVLRLLLVAAAFLACGFM
ncbi:hypothetical protein PFISCL1PPCAC_4148, partial [Pristionchus fissidentatus]